VVKRLSGVRCRGPLPQPQTETADTNLRYADTVEALAHWADFLVLTCPGGPATHHLVTRAVLDALGQDGTLVNVARGNVVDEAALVAALLDKRLSAAAWMSSSTNRKSLRH
jgi:lactate dehydrogenase-like 2-hydroxyacid dehydrogenase